MVLPPAEPELCVTTHALGRGGGGAEDHLAGRMVRHPESGPRLPLLHRLPAHLAGGALHATPGLPPTLLRLAGQVSGVQPGLVVQGGLGPTPPSYLAQGQPGECNLPLEGRQLGSVLGEDLHHTSLHLRGQEEEEAREATWSL